VPGAFRPYQPSAFLFVLGVLVIEAHTRIDDENEHEDEDDERS
jgi:hypothetical protein